jgi:hypothetical protein
MRRQVAADAEVMLLSSRHRDHEAIAAPVDGDKVDRFKITARRSATAIVPSNKSKSVSPVVDAVAADLLRLTG